MRIGELEKVFGPISFIQGYKYTIPIERRDIEIRKLLVEEY